MRTHNKYVGPGGVVGGGGSVKIESADQAEPDSIPIKKRWLIYHGAREGFEGKPRPSKSGRFGPGFYVTAEGTAELYATYSPKVVGWINSSEGKEKFDEQFNGNIVEFDISKLNCKRVVGERKYPNARQVYRRRSKRRTLNVNIYGKTVTIDAFVDILIPSRTLGRCRSWWSSSHNARARR